MFSYYTSILILCGLSLLAMCVLVHENDRIPLYDKRLLYVTYVLIATSALAEWCGVLLDGRPDIPGWLLKTAKCVDYILTPMAGGALSMQMQMRSRWQKAVNAVLIANAVLQVASIPFGWMVEIDAQNHYHHGPLFAVYLLACLAVIVLVIAQFVSYGRTFKRQNRDSLCIIMSLVLIGVVMQEIPGRQRTAYVAMTIGAMLMFIHYTEYSQLAADEVLRDQRIQLMLSQIRPHFLYNALGSIEALCGRDPMAAKQATRKFAKYLRFNMDSLTEEGLIPFEKELRHTQLYLELEQMRFGDALTVTYDIRSHGFFLPSLTLGPIAVNAVMHGVRMNADGRGTVWISTVEREDCFELQVADDGPGMDMTNVSPNDGHASLRNVRERLARICGGSLTIEPRRQRGIVVTMRVPKRG